jgi:hypothetical protein
MFRRSVLKLSQLGAARAGAAPADGSATLLARPLTRSIAGGAGGWWLSSQEQVARSTLLQAQGLLAASGRSVEAYVPQFSAHGVTLIPAGLTAEPAAEQPKDEAALYADSVKRKR